MSAAPRIAPVERYDTVCHYCGDGEPKARVGGKATCGKCVEVFIEGGSSIGIRYLTKVITQERLQKLITYVADSQSAVSYTRAWPLWKRVAVARGVYVA